MTLDAEKVPLIDHFPHRLVLARQIGAKTINFRESNVLEALMEMSGGIGVDVVIDAVGMESHGFTPENMLDLVKQKVGIGADRAHVLRQAIVACRKGGRVTVHGVYGGLADKFPP